MSKSNIEHFIPLYQQDKSFHQEHLTGLAYGLENLNSENIAPQTFKSKYEYVDALSDQSLKEGKIDMNEKKRLFLFSEQIRMLEAGATLPLSEYKKGLSEVYLNILSPQYQQGNSTIDKFVENTTLDKAVEEIPYPLINDKAREEMFIDLIHRTEIPNAMLDKDGVMIDGKHFDEIGLNDLTEIKMVIYEYMEGMWERQPSEVLEKLIDNPKMKELGIEEETIRQVDMKQSGSVLEGNDAFIKVVRAISDASSKDYDELLIPIVINSLNLDKNISVESVENKESFKIKVTDDNNEEVSLDANKVKVNLGYKGNIYPIERVIVNTEDNEKMIFLDEKEPQEKDYTILSALKEEFYGISNNSLNKVENILNTRLYSNTINDKIINSFEKESVKKKFSNSFSI